MEHSHMHSSLGAVSSSVHPGVPLFLVVDSFNLPAAPLLSYLCKRWSKSRKVVLFNTESIRKDETTLLDIRSGINGSSFKIVDDGVSASSIGIVHSGSALHDVQHVDWFGNPPSGNLRTVHSRSVKSQTPVTQSSSPSISNLESLLASIYRKSQSGSTIVINSLSPILHRHSLSSIMSFLSQIVNGPVPFHRLVVLVHKDLYHSPSMSSQGVNSPVLQTLALASQQIISTYPTPLDIVSPSPPILGSFTVLTKLPSQKVSFTREHYSISPDSGSFVFYSDEHLTRDNDESAARSDSDEVNIHTMDKAQGSLSFNLGLGLSEGEEKAKRNVVLPFQKGSTEKDEGTFIFLDEADEIYEDFESDPDDDIDL